MLPPCVVCLYWRLWIASPCNLTTLARLTALEWVDPTELSLVHPNIQTLGRTYLQPLRTAFTLASPRRSITSHSSM